MAVLTAAERDRIPASQYGIPPKNGEKGRYPVNDKVHAAMALRFINKGKGVTSADKARIRRLAYKMLGKTPSGKDKKTGAQKMEDHYRRGS